MTKATNEKVEEPIATFKAKCVNCIKGPNLLKTIVVLICFVLVVQQISACLWKLVEKPITTYTHFDFNRTIAYPSLTFCREPPYKFDKMQEYGLFAHPEFSSAFQRYNFSIPLDELWQDITYDSTEFFAQYGLEGSMDNVEVETFIGYVHGRCYTLSPKILGTRASRGSGYSITLHHNAADIATSVSIYPPGYHVFIHYTREPFTEVPVHNGGLVDYLYSNVGETIEVKLSVNQYLMISRDDDPCNNDDGYSANNCTTQYVWDYVGQVAGCSGPWMLNSRLPRCKDYHSFNELMIAYSDYITRQYNSSGCPRFCRSYLYKAFVNDRHQSAWDSVTQQWTAKYGDAALQTQLYIYFNTMMVSVYEERYNYDWNLFISDLGGSVGFLLGLSVISIMSIFGKFWSIFVSTSNKSKDAEANTAPDEKTYQNGINCKEKNMLKFNEY